MFKILVTLENIFSAWYEFRKGKANKTDVLAFERHLEDELFLLHSELSTKTYRHQGYKTFHVYDPKFRVINKACVRDRVVHHLVFTALEPLFQPRFIDRSYSCQVGKGIHKGVTDVHAALRKVSRNNTRVVWSLKMDIKKFFASVDQATLLQLLRKKVSDSDMLWLLETIVTSFSSDQGTGKGMPIGNLSSQIFANIYLSELDYFVKQVLREKNYFRYADDFLFLHADRKHLEEICVILQKFVAERLKLTVHPDKIVYRKYSQGVDWLGYVLLPRYHVLRAGTKRRMFKKLRRKAQLYNELRLSDYGLSQSLQSYMGMLRHCNGYQLSQSAANCLFFEVSHFTLGK